MDSWETDLNASTLETSIMVSANEIVNVQPMKIASWNTNKISLRSNASKKKSLMLKLQLKNQKSKENLIFAELI